MPVRSLLIAALCSLFIPGIANADLESFISEVNTSYSANANGFQARLADRFAVSDSKLKLVVLSVDNPADAVVSLWIEEQSRLPIGQVLQYYQQLKQQGWKAIVTSLGLSMETGTLAALQRGDLGWHLDISPQGL